MFEYKKWLKFISFFLFSYALILAIWLEYKNIYNNSIAKPMFSIVAWKYDFSITKIDTKDNELQTTLTNSIPLRDQSGRKQDFTIDVVFNGSTVTSNVPMTLALLITITLIANGPFSVKLKYIVFGMGALIGLHIITFIIMITDLLSSTSKQSQLLEFYMGRHWTPANLLHNISDFLSVYAARFEPFLIAILVYLRFNNHIDFSTKLLNKNNNHYYFYNYSASSQLRLSFGYNFDRFLTCKVFI